MELLTDVNYEESLKLAKEFDKLRKQNAEIVDSKLLYGIPISIKDCIDIKGNIICSHKQPKDSFKKPFLLI